MKNKLIWTDSLYFFLRNLPQIASLCLPWLIAGAVIEYLIVVTPSEAVSKSMFIWAVAFNVAVLPIYTAALILLMSQQAQNRRPGNRELLKSALKVWPPFVSLYVLGGMLFIFVSFLALSVVTQMISLLLGAQAGPLVGLIIVFPLFVWVLAKLSFAKFYIVLGHLNPVEAVLKSFQVTPPYVRLILSLVALYAVPIVVMIFLSVNMLPETPIGYAARALIGTIASFLLLFVDVLLFRIYMDAVRGRKDNPGVVPRK